MKEWKEVKLGDFIEVKHGFAFSGNNITTEQTQNILVTPGNFQIGGGFKSSKFKYYNDEVPENYILQENDIIVTMTDLSKESDTLGYSAKVPKSEKSKKYLHNQRIGLVQFKNSEMNQDFIYWLMRTRSYQGYIVASASGTSIMHTSPSRIEDYVFLAPPLPEQKAIAEVLSSLDDKIDLLHRQNRTLEEMAETLFRQWFIEERDEGWEEVSLGDSSLCKIIGSGINVFEGEKIYLATADIQENEIVNRNTIIQYNKKPSRANMQPVLNSVWFAKKGGVRKVIMFDRNTLDDIESLILSTGFSGLKTTEKSHYYIWCFIYSREFQELKDNLLSGSVQPDINNDGIRNIVIARPSDKTLVEFNEVVYPLFRKISKNNKNVGILMNIRDTLLPKLMSGEVRLNYGK